MRSGEKGSTRRSLSLQVSALSPSLFYLSLSLSRRRLALSVPFSSFSSSVSRPTSTSLSLFLYLSIYLFMGPSVKDGEEGVPFFFPVCHFFFLSVSLSLFLFFRPRSLSLLSREQDVLDFYLYI